MTSPNRQLYAQRIEKVLQYIADNLDGDLSLEQLSRVAGFSKFHFHRQFRELTGVSAGRLIAMMRLKRASYDLALAPERRVLDVALDAGFESPESFARAFRRVMGQSPSQFRAAPEWERWVEVFRSPLQSRSHTMQVRIVHFEGTRVAALEHRGSASTLMATVQRFIEWRKSSGISPYASSLTLGIAYVDPSAVPEDEFWFDICGSIERDVPDNDYGVIEKVIPAGRCAVARHIGSTDRIAETVHAMYGQWLPDSGETLRDFPMFFHYIDRMPNVAEHEQVTDVYLPLR